MATEHCWTLWQNLPPRYQLSTRDMVEEWDCEAVSRSNQDSPVTPRTRRESPRYPSAITGYREPNLSVVPKQGCLERSRDFVGGCKVSAFPQRQSRYINAMKSQLRVNSARQNANSDPSKIACVPSMRRRSSQPFPVTRLSNVDGSNEERLVFTSCGKDAKGLEMSNRSTSHKRLAVHNLFPFEDSEHTQPIRDRAKKYLVNELQDATMFIDNDKIIYFKSTKFNVTRSAIDGTKSYSAKDDGGSYLAHLRRLYLKNAKDVSKKRNESELNNAFLQEVRCDYDRKVGHILEYYSHADIEREEHNANDQGRHTPVLRQLSRGRRGRLRSPDPGGTRLRSLLSSTSRVQTPHSESGSVERYRDPLEDWSLYLKFNQMAILHDKQFYLRTPDIGALLPGARNVTSANKGGKCSCRMCSAEMELTDIAQTNRTVIGMHEHIPTYPKLELEREIGSPRRPTPTDSEKDLPNAKSTLTGEHNDHNESMLKRGEHLTITLPGIAEEREFSDVSSIVTSRNSNNEDVVKAVLHCKDMHASSTISERRS